MLGDFENEAVAAVVGLERRQNRRKIIVERNVDDGADPLSDAADIVRGGGGCHGFVPCLLALERLRARDDFDRFLGDRRRSEERRVGNKCVSTGSSRRSQYHSKK